MSVHASMTFSCNINHLFCTSFKVYIFCREWENVHMGIRNRLKVQDISLYTNVFLIGYEGAFKFPWNIITKIQNKMIFDFVKIFVKYRFLYFMHESIILWLVTIPVHHYFFNICTGILIIMYVFQWITFYGHSSVCEWRIIGMWLIIMRVMWLGMRVLWLGKKYEDCRLY